MKKLKTRQTDCIIYHAHESEDLISLKDYTTHGDLQISALLIKIPLAYFCGTWTIIIFVIFPHSSVSEESACSAGDLGSIPGLGRSPGEENCNPLHYSCLENSMDRLWGRKELDMTEGLTLSLSWNTALLWQRGLHNPMKLWAMLYRVMQDGQVIVKCFDKKWSTGGENGKSLQYSCPVNPVNQNEIPVWNTKKIWYQKRNPPGWKTSNILLGKNIGQLLLALKRMKWLVQSRNDAQLWMCLIVKSLML